MKSAEGSVGRVFVLRLEDGDVIPQCIEEFAARHRIMGGFCALLGGIGRGSLVVGPEDGEASPIVPLVARLAGIHEAAAFGTIFPSEAGTPRLHMHAALGREGSTRTGCVRLGIDVWKTCEVVILEILGTDMKRKFDETSGFEVLSSP